MRAALTTDAVTLFSFPSASSSCPGSCRRLNLPFTFACGHSSWEAFPSSSLGPGVSELLKHLLLGTWSSAFDHGLTPKSYKVIDACWTQQIRSRGMLWREGPQPFGEIPVSKTCFRPVAISCLPSYLCHFSPLLLNIYCVFL